MRIAVVSCWKYRDAWRPMLELLEKFWDPIRPNSVHFVTDQLVKDEPHYRALGRFVDGFFSINRDASWSEVVAEYASGSDEPILLLQEDFFLNAAVNEELVAKGYALLMCRDNIG